MGSKRRFTGLLPIAAAVLCSFDCSCGGPEPETPAVTPSLKISTETFDFNYNAQVSTFTVTCNMDWGVALDGAPDWVTVSPGGGLSGTTEVRLTLKENKGSEPRTAPIIFKSGTLRKEYTVSQGVNTESGIVVPDGYKLVWQDEFDEGDVPSQNEWWYETGGGGWGNNEVQTYVAGSQNGTKLATVSNGTLKIQARKIDGNVYSIRMNTKKYWTYGWFEARLKVSDLEGAWPAFWMMPQNFKAWPDDGEIDIMEYAISTQGKDKVSSSIHCKAFNWPAGTQKTHVKQISNAASEYHVYALEWTADQMKFYVDGELHLTFKNDGQGYEHWPFNAPFYLKLNLAWGGNMGGKTNDSGLPATYEVDYVRVFQKR